MTNRKRQKKYMYGIFYHETSEFRTKLAEVVEKHRGIITRKLPITHSLNNEMINLRNEIFALLQSWIGQKVFESKFGIRIPLSSTTLSLEDYVNRQQRSKNDIYDPCEVCGERRITDYCHIVPRMMGGPSAEENYLYLCPTHHHLFDSRRLSPEEWKILDFSSRSASAQAYAKKYLEPFIMGEKRKKGIYGVRLEDFGMVARKRGLPVPKGDPRLKRAGTASKNVKREKNIIS